MFKEQIIKEILDRRRFVNLFFIVFYSANSLMKLEFWKYNYSIEEASKRYQELTKKFFLEIPGNYWLLHHVMPNYDLYSPSYLIAAMRVNSIVNEMEEQLKCLRCGFEYRVTTDDKKGLQERVCPKCKSNSVRCLLDKKE